ncbi:hypothetical protein BP5796_01658 [Coleophoma crateriformis]|uniref:Uncharacterized protein n=1 Tax=Coleophoma crateriformis TaxID=565419 RepID=A0A3D8T153_9HELO|nr:hypothetical protein BP5796_01658 [Coleophoma crateriformis]
MGFITPTIAPDFSLKEEVVENFRPMKVRVIGAGCSGIYLGIRIPQRILNVDLQIYEKNEGLGGTWWENRYPGCACDVPAHSYQFSFAPNPNWSGFYAPSEEICQYLHDVADKQLRVEKTATGEVFEDDADIVISARGNLNEMSWPNIPGLKEFEGERMHSAAWNQSYDFTGKRVGIIGGGSSSIQIVPKLQAIEGTHLSCFVRSKMWISNPFGDIVMQELGLDPKVLHFTEEQQREFATDKDLYLKFRKTIEADGNAIHASSFRGSDMQVAFQAMLQDMIQDRLASKPDIIDSFKPTFGIGCRRLTPGIGYLEALVKDNVDFISDKIVSIEKDGARLENGKSVNFDVLVCATGFNTSSIPPFDIIGNTGESLKEKFLPYPKTYLAMGVDDFPNFFMMLGPNAGVGAGSLTLVLEGQGDYIVKCIRKLQKEDYATMTPKRARVQDFSDYVGQYFKRTVYLDKCKSWYKTEGGEGDRISALWPGSSLHMLETLRAPRWEDYEFESRDENRLRWLGNGWSVSLIEGQGDPSWYINPDVVDIPPLSTPENDPKNKIRSFSH